MKNPSKPPISQALVLRTWTLLWKTSWVHPNHFMLEFPVNSEWFTEAEVGHQGTLQAIRVHQILQKFLETHTETSLYPPYTIRATVSAIVSFTFFCDLLINASVHTQDQLIWRFQTFPHLPCQSFYLKMKLLNGKLFLFKENRPTILTSPKTHGFFKSSLWSRRELSRVIDASRSSWASKFQEQLTSNMTLFKSWHAPKIRHPWRLLGNGLAPSRISQVFSTDWISKLKPVYCLHFSPNRTLDMKEMPRPTCLRNFHSPFSHFFTDPLTIQMHLYWLLRKMQADILFGRGIACLQLTFERKTWFKFKRIYI